jgi:predicted RNase H-like HicB family nuclease
MPGYWIEAAASVYLGYLDFAGVRTVRFEQSSFIVTELYAKMIEREEGGGKMDFYTVVLRKSGDDWVTLCLENGIAGQGITKEESIRKLKEAIESFEDIRKSEEDVYSAPISIKELHEFLAVEGKNLVSETFELVAVNA